MDTSLLRSLPKDVLIYMIEKKFNLEEFISCEDSFKLIKIATERIKNENDFLKTKLRKSSYHEKDLSIEPDCNYELNIKNDLCDLKLNFHIDSINFAFLWNNIIMNGFHFENFAELFSKMDEILRYSYDMDEIKKFIQDYYETCKSYEILFQKRISFSINHKII